MNEKRDKRERKCILVRLYPQFVPPLVNQLNELVWLSLNVEINLPTRTNQWPFSKKACFTYLI